MVEDKAILKRKMEELQRMEPKNVSFSGDAIKFEFDGTVIENKVTTVRHELWAESYSRKVPEVYVDDDLSKRFVLPISLHGSIEKYLGERYGLSGNAEGHEITETIERNFAMKHLGFTEDDWSEYSKEVERIHRDEFDYMKRHIRKFLKWERKKGSLPKEVRYV